MANKKDLLGDRMKEYESIPKVRLMRKTPAIIRIDGKAFHSFTRGMVKPFDVILMGAMQRTMLDLCKNVQGCVFGYTQSDEITLVLTDYRTINTDAWFGYVVQKMCSIASSMATTYFNLNFASMVTNIATNNGQYKIDTYTPKFNKAMFDARVFSIPKHEVCNCLIWRQQDAIRNSVQSVAHAYLGHSKSHGKSSEELKKVLMEAKNIEWGSYPVDCQRGACCYKKEVDLGDGRVRHKWLLDNAPPIFTQNREYIEQWV